MKFNFKYLLSSLALTTLLLVSSEIIVSTMFPMIGLQFFRISLSSIIILYLCFYFNNIFIAPLIMYFEFVHGLFTVENWAISSFAFLIVSVVISYLRDLIHLSIWHVTFIYVQVFQFVLFGIESSLVYFKQKNWNFFHQRQNILSGKV